MSNNARDNLINAVLVSTSVCGLLMMGKGLLVSLPHGVVSYETIRNPVLISLVLVMNSFFVYFFLTRRAAPKKMTLTDTTTFVWAYLGSYVPFFFGFKDFLYIPFIDILIGLSAIWAIFSILKLGKSTDILVSNRGIVTTGSYGYVRHPLYASYIITNTLYLLISPIYFWRVVLYLFWVICVYMRIHYEELLLSQSPEYREYSKKVPYRLFPKIW